MEYPIFVEIRRPKGTTLETALAALREADPDLGDFAEIDAGEDDRGAWTVGTLELPEMPRSGLWLSEAGPYSATAEIP